MPESNQDRPRRKRSKKQLGAKAAAASTSPKTTDRPRRRRAEPEPPAESAWTNGHMFMAVVFGVAVGGFGGYTLAGGKDAATPSKDATAATGAAATAATGAPGAPAKGPDARPTPPPSAPVYIELADYSPRIGPKHAKVTILEFSDFQ